MSSSELNKYVLGDIIDIKHGFAFKGEFFSQTETDDVLLSPGNFKIGGGFKDDKFKYYNGIYPKEYILKENDIIVTMTDLSKEGDTLGYSAKIPFSENKKYLHNQRLGLVQFKNEEFDKDYVYWLLRTKEYQSFIVNSATGTTVKHTAPTRIKEYEFLAPNKAIQTKIANILSSIDDKIELNRQTNLTLEIIAQTIFKEMCLPKSDVLPEGWGFGKLGEICNISSGKGLKREQFTENGFDVLGANGRIGFTDNYLIDDEFILTGRVGTLGTFQLVYEKCWISDNVLALKPINKNSLHYVYFWLKTIDFKNLNRGSTQPLVTKTDLQSLEVFFPNELIVENFNILSRSLFEQIKSNNKETQTLITLRDSLLPKLMKGEIVL